MGRARQYNETSVSLQNFEQWKCQFLLIYNNP